MHQLPHLDIPRVPPAELSAIERHPVALFLDRIRSAHNVGTMIRTADGLLMREVILSGFTPDIEHKGVHKASLGAQDFVPSRRVDAAVDDLKRLKSEGWTIAAMEITSSPSSMTDLTLDDFPLILVAGNEIDGVSEEVLSVCDLSLELPQFGAKQSLNVAVASGILSYDVIRHYRALSGRPAYPEHDPRAISS